MVGICKVCELLDDDSSIKTVAYCKACKENICYTCEPNLLRRGRAATITLTKKENKMKTTATKMIIGWAILVTIILLMMLTSCAKTPEENPQPIGHKLTTHNFEIVGEPNGSQLIYHDTSFQNNLTGVPNFKLNCGEYFQFLSGSNPHTPTVTIKIYMDGVVIKEWENYSGRIQFDYTTP